uniref:ParB/Sulfiredoxin domain-containing protein n=1 Tax=Hot spring virus BHS1 TaxID=2024351 RepID=A0A2U7NSU0_9VIRU|nr:hypothetical protein [Hot spring virus BHS1]
MKLSSFRPQRLNPNRHKPHGLEMLAKSMARDGYSAPMIAAADGEIIAGSARLEKAAEVFGLDAEPIVIRSDGTRPIIHVRDDIPTADDPRAKRLGVADNVIASADYDPDGEILAALAAYDDAIAAMVRQDDRSADAILRAEYKVEMSDWPEFEGGTLHQFVVKYEPDDEEAIKRFIGQLDDKPLSPTHAGRRCLERIKEIAGSQADQ